MTMKYGETGTDDEVTMDLKGTLGRVSGISWRNQIYRYTTINMETIKLDIGNIICCTVKLGGKDDVYIDQVRL